jgi:hypothetical protein
MLSLSFSMALILIHNSARLADGGRGVVARPPQFNYQHEQAKTLELEERPEPRSGAPAQSVSHPLVLPLVQGITPLMENLLKAFQTFNYFFLPPAPLQG